MLMDTDVLYRKTAPWARRIFVDGFAAFFDGTLRITTWLAEQATQGMQDPTRWFRRVPPGKTGPFNPDREREPLQEPLVATLFVFVCVALLVIDVLSSLCRRHVSELSLSQV